MSGENGKQGSHHVNDKENGKDRKEKVSDFATGFPGPGPVGHCGRINATETTFRSIPLHSSREAFKGPDRPPIDRTGRCPPEKGSSTPGEVPGVAGPTEDELDDELAALLSGQGRSRRLAQKHRRDGTLVL